MRRLQWVSRRPHLLYLQGGAPYQAKVVAYTGQVHGGIDPYIEAFKVNDLVVVTDQETGDERFEFTRQIPDKLPLLVDRERERSDSSTFSSSLQ